MPLKFTNSKAFLKILWTNEDKSRTATFVIHKELGETEQVQELLKAVGFLGMQTGVVPAITPMTATGTATTSPTAPQASAATPTSPTPAPLILGTPPASLSDRPSDGGRPANFEFWESMPTLAVPQHLAGEAQGGWEMIPPGEA